MAGTRVGDHAERRDLQGVQFLRAFAVLLVVANHSLLILADDGYFGRDLLRAGLAEKGAIGVDLFFVVSGFIIAYVSLRPGSLMPKVGVADFAIKRVVRIIPFLWFAVVLYAAIRLITIQEFDPVPYLNAMLILPVGELRPNVVWTLRHELLFYALFALSFLLQKRTPWLVYVWALAPLVAWPVLTALAAEPDSELLRFLIAPSNVNFAVGLTIGLVYLRMRMGGSAPIPMWFAWLLLGGALAGLVAARDALPVPATALLAGCALLVALTLPTQRDPISRFLAMLGDASYSIYLTHNVAILIGAELWIRLLGDRGHGVAFAVVFVAATTFGVVLHFLVERPLITATNRIVRSKAWARSSRRAR